MGGIEDATFSGLKLPDKSSRPYPEAFGTPVETGFIYLLPIQEVVAVELTRRLKEEALARLAAIRLMITEGDPAAGDRVQETGATTVSSGTSVTALLKDGGVTDMHRVYARGSGDVERTG